MNKQKEGVIMKNSGDSKPKRKDHDDDDERHHQGPTGKGRERVVHEEIIAKRLEGGAPPTMDAYTRALEEWQKLPGSVMRTPTDVTLPPAQKPLKPPEARPMADDAEDKEDLT
jgi:hypothetical protein